MRSSGSLAEVVADDLGDVGVDQLVVGDAVPDGAGDDDVAGPCHIDQARDAQHRVGPELQRVEEGVIDAPVDDVDAGLAVGGAHVGDVVAADEVAALDQLDTHLPSEQECSKYAEFATPG